MNKKVLIISYFFPPSNKIGGRRWGKFSKFFIHNNLDVQVLTSKNNDENGWISDLKYLGNKVDQISFNYPYYLGVNPKSIKEKLMYKISLIWSKLNTKSNFYDKSVHGEKELISKTIHYIEKGYKNIVVTVAPFHLATHISKIIPNYPDCNFIVDFRDPWIDNKTAYGYYSLTESRRQNERNSEERVVNLFNHVVTVNDSITNQLRGKYFESKAKFHTILNGFDFDDLVESSTKNHLKDDKIRLIFSGTLYDKAEKYFDHLLNLMTDLKNSNKTFYDKIEIDVYGYSNYCSLNSHKNIRFNGFVSNEKVNSEIEKAHACLLFLTDDINYSFSTKFCEYIAYEKPIIIFSNNGLTAKFVDENKIGFSLNLSTNCEYFLSVLFRIKYESDEFYSFFRRDDFDLRNISKKYLKLFK
mgnify:FL=1|jgi:glycosyltransferase involved in cell wall biosynthesis